MLVGVPNRVPRPWNSPDAFDFSRDPSGYVGFGMGIHQCVGQHLARPEAEVLSTALARRVERVEIANLIRCRHNNTLRA